MGSRHEAEVLGLGLKSSGAIVFGPFNEIISNVQSNFNSQIEIPSIEKLKILYLLVGPQMQFENFLNKIVLFLLLGFHVHEFTKIP